MLRQVHSVIMLSKIGYHRNTSLLRFGHFYCSDKLKFGSDSINNRPVVRLKESEEIVHRTNVNHPWIFDTDILYFKNLNKLPHGTPVAVFDSASNPVGSGLLSRNASVTVRLFSKNPSAAITPDVIQRRIENACKLSMRLNDSKTNLVLVDGESSGIPGLHIVQYQSVIHIRMDTVSLSPYRTAIIGAVDRLLHPSTVILHSLVSKSEKLSTNGLDEYKVEIVKGNQVHGEVNLFAFDDESNVSFLVDLLSHSVTPAAQHRLTLTPLLEFCSRVSARAGTSTGMLEIRSRAGAISAACLAAGAKEIICIEELYGAAQLTQQNLDEVIAKGGHNAQMEGTVLFRSDICSELNAMAMAKLKFGLVVVNLQPPIVHRISSRKHQKVDENENSKDNQKGTDFVFDGQGQFGRFHQPSLKGAVKEIEHALKLVKGGGYLAVTLKLPTSKAHVLTTLVYNALRAAELKGTVVMESGLGGGLGLHLGQTDYWHDRSIVVHVKNPSML